MPASLPSQSVSGMPYSRVLVECSTAFASTTHLSCSLGGFQEQVEAALGLRQALQDLEEIRDAEGPNSERPNCGMNWLEHVPHALEGPVLSRA